MVLEAVILCMDNSDWCRNGDYHPSRWESQVESANLIGESKCEKNPENGIGVISMAGKRVEVHVTLTNDLAMILNSIKNINLSSECDFITALNISTLALKHRANKNQKQRIILFVGSPIKHTVEEMTQTGKKLKKYNIAVDIISFGSVEENKAHISSFFAAVNNSNNSSVLEVPVGYYIMDSLFTSPIMNDDMQVDGDVNIPNTGAGGNVPQGNVNQQGVGMSQFELDMNTALQMSIEDEKKKSAEQAKGTSTVTKKDDDVEMKGIDEEDEEDELEKARLMSLQEHENMVQKQTEEEDKVKDELLGNEEFINDLLKEIPSDQIKSDEIIKQLKDKKDKDGENKK